MLVIRLSRIGGKNRPFFRLVIQEKRRAPASRVIEFVGHYNPRANPAVFEVKEDRVKYWLSQGAQPSPTVHNFLVDKKILKGPKVVVSKAKKKQEEKSVASATPK